MDWPVGVPTRLVIVKLKVACVPAALTRKRRRANAIADDAGQRQEVRGIKRAGIV